MPVAQEERAQHKYLAFTSLAVGALGAVIGFETYAEQQGWLPDIVPGTVNGTSTTTWLYTGAALTAATGTGLGLFLLLGPRLEGREAQPPVRISVAAIVPKVRVEGSSTTESFGVMSHNDPNTFSAAGGAVRLTEKGKRYIKNKFGATNFEREGDMDARFTVPGKHEEAVKRFFENPDPRYFDVNPTDMVKELTKGSNEAADGALTQEDIDRIKIVRVDVSRQPPPENEEDTRKQNPDRPVSRRVFHRYEIVVPPDVYEKLKKSPGVRIFTPEEVATTGGGVRVGTTTDGKKIGTNIY